MEWSKLRWKYFKLVEILKSSFLSSKYIIAMVFSHRQNIQKLRFKDHTLAVRSPKELRIEAS